MGVVSGADASSSSAPSSRFSSELADSRRVLRELASFLFFASSFSFLARKAFAVDFKSDVFFNNAHIALVFISVARCVMRISASISVSLLRAATTFSPSSLRLAREAFSSSSMFLCFPRTAWSFPLSFLRSARARTNSASVSFSFSKAACISSPAFSWSTKAFFLLLLSLSSASWSFTSSACFSCCKVSLRASMFSVSAVLSLSNIATLAFNIPMCSTSAASLEFCSSASAALCLRAVLSSFVTCSCSFKTLCSF
mmetsp:Transcript_8036/g.14759  ORF Transcript_8036/g.14759 Transcript_8036/m.14759 type:complete len:255 (+) Transcript_8036:103-867(+)